MSDDEDKYDFYGTLMEGVDLCIFEFCGLSPTDEEREEFLGDTTVQRFLLEEDVVEEFEIESSDFIPGMSDSRYGYLWSGDVEEIKQALRARLLEIMNSGDC